MKKTYIQPTAKCFVMSFEGMIAESFNVHTSGGDNQNLSNERESASSSIWGED